MGASEAIKVGRIGLQSPPKPTSMKRTSSQTGSRSNRRASSNTSRNPGLPSSPFSTPIAATRKNFIDSKESILLSPTTPVASPPPPPPRSKSSSSSTSRKSSIRSITQTFEEQETNNSTTQAKATLNCFKKPPPSPFSSPNTKNGNRKSQSRRSLLKKSASVAALDAKDDKDFPLQDDSQMLSQSTHSVSTKKMKKKCHAASRGSKAMSQEDFLATSVVPFSNHKDVGDGLFRGVLQRQNSSARNLVSMIEDGLDVVDASVSSGTSTPFTGMNKNIHTGDSLASSAHFPSTGTAATTVATTDDDCTIESITSDISPPVSPTTTKLSAAINEIVVPFCADGGDDQSVFRSVLQRQTSSRRLLFTDDDDEDEDTNLSSRMVASMLPKRRSAPATASNPTSPDVGSPSAGQSKIASLRAKKRNLETTRHSIVSPAPPRSIKSKSVVSIPSANVVHGTINKTKDLKENLCRRQALIKTKSMTWLNNSARSIGSEKPSSTMSLIDALKEDDKEKEDDSMVQTNVTATTLVAAMLPAKAVPKKKKRSSAPIELGRVHSLSTTPRTLSRDSIDGDLPPPAPKITPVTSRKKAWEMREQWKHQSLSQRNLNTSSEVEFQRQKHRIDLMERSLSLRKFLNIDVPSPEEQKKKQEEESDFKIFNPKPDDLFFNKKENKEVEDEEEKKKLREQRDREQRRLQRRLQRQKAGNSRPTRAKSTMTGMPSMFTAHLDFP